MKRLFVLLSVVLLLGACGDDGGKSASSSDSNSDTAAASDSSTDKSKSNDSKAAKEYVNAVADSLTASSDLPVDDKQAECIAKALVAVVGVDALDAASISPDDLAGADNLSALDVDIPAGAAEALGKSIAKCDAADALESPLLSGFISAASTDVALPSDAASCLSDHLDDDAVAEGYASAFIDGSSDGIQSPLLESVGACPTVAAAAIIAGFPAPPTPEVTACVNAFVASHPDEVTKGLVGGAGSPEATALGQQLGLACPGIAG